VLSLLRRNRDVRLVFSAQVISFAGDWFATVAVVGLVLDLTDSGFAAAAIFVAQSLPAFAVTPLAGPVADRFDRRMVMVAVSVAQTGAALAFLAVGSGRVWVAFAAQGSITALGAFFTPASQAALPNLVDPEDLATATSMMAATWGAMLAVGAALGAAFTVLFGRQAAFVADAASFAIAAGLISLVRRPMRAEPLAPHTSRMRPLADTADAIRYARSRPPVLALLGSKCGLGLATGVVGVLAVLADKHFHAGDGGIGILLSARGLGALAGPIVAHRVAGRGVRAQLLTCGLSAVTFGFGYLLVPLSPVVLVAGVCAFVGHIGGGTQWTVSTYGLQLLTPDHLRGRIHAADFALVTLTGSVSYLVAGVLAGVIGARGTIALGAAVALLWGAGYLAATRHIRPGEDGYAARSVTGAVEAGAAGASADPSAGESVPGVVT